MTQSNEVGVIIGRLEPGFLKGLIHAEHWRKFHREDPDATIDIYEEFDAAIEELNFLRDKLEAVKGWWDLFNQCIDSEAVKDKLWKILEDVDVDEETI